MGWEPVRSRIPDLCRERKISAQECAKGVEMSDTEISDYSHLRKIMSLRTAKTFGEFFGIPIDDLYDWTYEKSKRRSRGKEKKSSS